MNWPGLRLNAAQKLPEAGAAGASDGSPRAAAGDGATAGRRAGAGSRAGGPTHARQRVLAAIARAQERPGGVAGVNNLLRHAAARRCEQAAGAAIGAWRALWRRIAAPTTEELCLCLSSPTNVLASLLGSLICFELAASLALSCLTHRTLRRSAGGDSIRPCARDLKVSVPVEWPSGGHATLRGGPQGDSWMLGRRQSAIKTPPLEGGLRRGREGPGAGSSTRQARPPATRWWGGQRSTDRLRAAQIELVCRPHWSARRELRPSRAC
jgi:hypothetical protein